MKMLRIVWDVSCYEKPNLMLVNGLLWTKSDFYIKRESDFSQIHSEHTRISCSLSNE